MLQNRDLMSAMLVAIIITQTAEAGQITNLQLFDGTSHSPIVTVNYTNADGTGHNEVQTYADPMVSKGTKAPLYDCIDLWHDNDLGSTYTFTSTSKIPYATSTFKDVDNRLAWLVDHPQSTVDDRAAVQLALWYTIDNVATNSIPGFSYTGGDSTLRSDYNQLISFSGYDPDVHYAANLWAAHHDPSNKLYQDLISAVPEPSGLILAGIGLATALGVHARRARASSAPRA